MQGGVTVTNIHIVKKGITKLDVDCVVNAANEGLWAGGGVCGAIFREAGYDKLEEACREIGHCDTGSVVITPGFELKAKYIIHAVGPRWQGGNEDEDWLLRKCYMIAMLLAKDNGCKSIGFPLISSGIFGYPKTIIVIRLLNLQKDMRLWQCARKLPEVLQHRESLLRLWMALLRINWENRLMNISKPVPKRLCRRF
jgi:O-acetyl-ADP-ribose deacetylase (regulator of RNase III)